MVCLSASTAAHRASIEAGHDENSVFFFQLTDLVQTDLVQSEQHT